MQFEHKSNSNIYDYQIEIVWKHQEKQNDRK